MIVISTVTLHGKHLFVTNHSSLLLVTRGSLVSRFFKAETTLWRPSESGMWVKIDSVLGEGGWISQAGGHGRKPGEILLEASGFLITR